MKNFVAEIEKEVIEELEEQKRAKLKQSDRMARIGGILQECGFTVTKSVSPFCAHQISITFTTGRYNYVLEADVAAKTLSVFRQGNNPYLDLKDVDVDSMSDDSIADYLYLSLRERVRRDIMDRLQA